MIVAMELTIGEITIDAKVIGEGTYTSDKSKKELRELTVKFSIEGANAFDKFRELSIDVVRYGVRSDEAFWIASELSSGWQNTSVARGSQVSESNSYEVVWVLREDES
jgi:hypothetical protein